MQKNLVALVVVLALGAGVTAAWMAGAQTAAPAPLAVVQEVGVATMEGMPPVADRTNLYREVGAGNFSPAVAQALERVYVPNRSDNTVSVIDPVTLKVVSTFKVGVHPQHVVPSWDLKTLWVANNAEGRTDGSLTPIDPKTARPGKSIAVDDPYNMYWSPDGRYAIVVAEAYKRLDFRDVVTMELKFSIPTPRCAGSGHRGAISVWHATVGSTSASAITAMTAAVMPAAWCIASIRRRNDFAASST